MSIHVLHQLALSKVDSSFTIGLYLAAKYLVSEIVDKSMMAFALDCKFSCLVGLRCILGGLKF